MPRIILCLTLLCLFAPQAARAQAPQQTPIPPSDSDSQALEREELRASLLTAWEQNIMKDPDTRVFKKTITPNVYYVETDLLPYKGHVKIVNLVIRPYVPTADYDKRVAYSGVVETELLEPPPDLPGRDSISGKEWAKLSWFNYDKATSEWFPTSTWQRHFPSVRHVRIETPLSITNESSPSFTDVVAMVSGVTFGVFFVFFLGAAAVYGRRQHKIKGVMDEHTQILRDILTALREK